MHPEHYYTEKPTSKLKEYKIETTLRGKTFKFISSSGIFSKRHVDPGTRLLIESMVIFEGSKVLDLGCGYGPIGIVAAFLNKEGKVILSDINERALGLAKINLKLNKIKNAEVIKSNLFENIKETFDIIISNPPYTIGKTFIEKLIKESYEHLNKGGLLQIVTTTRYNYVKDYIKTYFDEGYLITKKGVYIIYFGLKL